MSQYGHIIGKAFRDAKNLPPVGRGKSAVVAFVTGVLFGPIGLGLYLRSWGDFFIPLTLIIGGSIMTAGIGAPFFWALTGAWGAWRVSLANQSKCGPSPGGWRDDLDDGEEDEPPALVASSAREARRSIQRPRAKRVVNEAQR